MITRPRMRIAAPAAKRPAALAPVALALSVLLLHQWYYLAAIGGDAIDDAYISFRYAANLVHGQGLVFNPGERVQGYTNFLWTVLLAPAIAAGLPIGPVSLALGALCALATLLLVASCWSPGLPAVGLLAAFLLAADGSFALWSVSGMETAPFTLLLVAGAGRYWRELEYPWLPPWSGPLFALATLTRPEGALVFGLTVLHAAAFRLLVQRRPPAWSDLGRVLAFALPVGAYLAFCLAYYGSIVPNTFADKVDPGSLEQLLRGWHALAAFVGVHGGWPVLLVLPLGMLALLSDRSAAGTRLRAGYAALVVLPYAAYIVLVGGDWSVGRFFVPILPFAYLVAAAGCLALLRRLEGETQPQSQEAMAPVATPLAFTFQRGALLVALLFLLFAHSSAEGERLLFVDAFAVKTMGEARTDMGLWLQTNTAPSAVIAVDAAGQMPYYAGHRVIDLYGLNDSAIAHLQTPQQGTALAGHEKFGLDYALRVYQPDYVVIYGDLLDAPVYQSTYHRMNVPWTTVPALRNLLSLYQRNAANTAYCRFVGAFQALHDLLPAQVGSCLADEQLDTGMGEVVQHTHGGLLMRPESDAWAAFTDGYRTWLNGPHGLQERLNGRRFPWEANPARLPLAGRSP